MCVAAYLLIAHLLIPTTSILRSLKLFFHPIQSPNSPNSECTLCSSCELEIHHLSIVWHSSQLSPTLTYSLSPLALTCCHMWHVQFDSCQMFFAPTRNAWAAYELAKRWASALWQQATQLTELPGERASITRGQEMPRDASIDSIDSPRWKW